MSGISSDMRALEASGEPAAADAIEYFVSRVKREIGGLAAILGGLDAIVFTGGIGENAWRVRRSVAGDMNWIGVHLDGQANREGAQMHLDARVAGRRSGAANRRGKNDRRTYGGTPRVFLRSQSLGRGDLLTLPMIVRASGDDEERQEPHAVDIQPRERDQPNRRRRRHARRADAGSRIDLRDACAEDRAAAW